MSTVVSVLCARVRVEEKRMIEALAAAGVPARPLPPASTPLPVGPLPSRPLTSDMVSGVVVEGSSLIVDRCANRTVASVTTPLLRAMGVTVIDAGLASTHTRLTVATSIAAAGLPRPKTLLVTSEDAGLAAVTELGCPVTLLPLDPGMEEIALVDRDIAECVLEHREVLGGSAAASALVQQGVAAHHRRTTLLVVDGRVVGISASLSSESATKRARELAEMTSRVLNASLVGIEIVETDSEIVVWDCLPVPQFRDMTPIGDRGIADSIAELVASRIGQLSATGLHTLANGLLVTAVMRREVAGDYVLSA